MRAIIATAMVAVAAIAPTAGAQGSLPRSWAGFGTASVNDWPHLSHGRFGGRAALPIRGRLDFYPGLEVEPELGLSQAFLDVRVVPFGRRGLSSLWYVGGGLALRAEGARSSLFTGLQWPAGRLRPFAEFHLFNGINGSGDLQVGVAVPVSRPH